MGRTARERLRIGTLIVGVSWVAVSRFIVALPPGSSDCPTWGTTGVVIAIQAGLAFVALATAVAMSVLGSESLGLALGWITGEALCFAVLAGWEYWEYGGACRLSF